MKRLHVLSILAALTLLLCCILPTRADAATSGYYTYKVSNMQATITDCKTSISGDVVIPETINGYPVVAIGDDAFYNCTKLTSLVIPDSVTSIGSYAFEQCTGLNSITLPTQVTYMGSSVFKSCSSLVGITLPVGTTSVGTNMFNDCSSLVSVTIPNTVTNIGYCAFYGCSSFVEVTIPDFVETIDSYAFADCSNLTSVTVSQSVTEINLWAFAWCEQLTGIWVDEENQYYSSDANGVLFNKAKTEVLQAPGAISGTYSIPEGVISIGRSAFEFCEQLTGIVIPDTVTCIGRSAFENCDELRSVSMPDSVTEIGYAAFDSCKSLAKIEIPYGVSTINDYTFSFCSKLTDITIPDSVTAIGANAFNYCDSLANVRIPNSVISIGENAFSSCESLTSITIPYSVTSIGEGAFSYCNALSGIWVDENNSTYSSDARGVLFNKNKTELMKAPYMLSGDYYIPEGVVSIADDAFSLCYSITSVIIPDSVTEIGQSAFYGNYMDVVTIGSGVVNIGESAFDSCDELEVVYFAGTLANWNEINIESGNSDLKNATFHLITEIQAISIATPPEKTIYRIGSKLNTTGLTISVTYTDGSTKTISGDFTLAGFSSATKGEKTVTVTHKGKSAVFTVEVWEDQDFYTYEVLDGAAVISSCNPTLSGDVMIPDTLGGYPVTGIADYAFYSCEELTGITIPSGVTSIGDYAFYYCDSLTSVTIPDSVTSIGDSAFDNCLRLTDIHYVGTEKQWNSISIGSYNDILQNVIFDIQESEKLTITKQPVSIVANNEAAVALTVEAEGNGLKYQWYRQEPGSTAWKAFTSAASKTANFTFTAYDYNNGRAYKCIITDAEGNKVETEVVTLTVRMITKQPTSQYGAPGKKATFTVGYSVTEGVTYQWQLKYASEGVERWRNTSATGNKTNTLTFSTTNMANRYMFRCVITDNGVVTITNEVSLWMVTDPATVTSAPSGTLNAVEGYYVFLRVKAEGQGMSYIWQASTDGGKTYYNCTSSASAKTADFRVIAYNYRQGYMYRCAIVTPNASGQNVTYTDWVTLNILPGVEITQQPKNATAKVGQYATFTVNAQMPACEIMAGEQQKGDGSVITYKWQRSKTGQNWTYINGATTSTLNIFATEELDGYYYRCVVFNDSNQGTGYIVSAPAQLKVTK